MQLFMGSRVVQNRGSVILLDYILLMSIDQAGLRSYLAVRGIFERKLSTFRFGELLSRVLVNKVAEVVSLLTLPLAGAALQLTEFHLAETLVIAIIPLEDILHALCLLSILRVLSAILRLEFGEILFD
jgi:hypothetical protein